MKAIRLSTLALSLILIVGTTMASNNEIKDDKHRSEDKTGITKQEVFTNVHSSLDEAADMVVMEATNNPVGSIPVDTKRSISEKLTYPEFAQDEQQNDVVAVSFTYTEEGYLKILSINSSDENLNPYIISKLENIRLTDGSVKIGKAYYARFLFKVL